MRRAPGSRSRDRPASGPRRRALVVLLGLAVVAAAAVVVLRVLPYVAVDPDAAFGTRPRSAPIDCDGDRGVTISGRTFRGIDDQRPAIVIRNCQDVVVEYNDFIDVAEPIYVYGSRNVVIRHNRYRDITGPHQRNGSHRGNFTQWDRSFGGAISDNRGVGGDTEDVISIYRSGGLSADEPLVIEGNRFEGTDWTSTSGSGILVGDGGGGHVVVRDNVLVDVGQVGIGVAGGRDIRLLRNTVYGSGRAGSNVGIYTWGQGVSCRGVEVRGNRVDFTKADGARAAIYDAGNCGRVDGIDDNRFDVRLDPARLRVRL